MVPSDYRTLDQKNKPPKKNCHGKKYTDVESLKFHDKRTPMWSQASSMKV